MKILVDSNEASTASWVVSQISAYPLLGIPEITKLPCGDIWILDNEPEPIIVERKEPNDLLASIADGRLPNQCAMMAQETSRAVLLITGQFLAGMDGKVFGTKWPINKVWSELFQVQEFGVKVDYCLNDTDFSHHLAWLAGRNWTMHITLPPKKIGLPMLDDQRILCSLPQIGYELSNRLLGQYNLRDALLCLLDPDCKVDGIKSKTKQNLRQLFNLSDNQKLEVKGELKND